MRGIRCPRQSSPRYQTHLIQAGQNFICSRHDQGGLLAEDRLHARTQERIPYSSYPSDSTGNCRPPQYTLLDIGRKTSHWPRRSPGLLRRSCRRLRRMDFESCGPAVFFPTHSCRSLPRPPASLGCRRKRYRPNAEVKAKSLDENPPESPAGSRANRKSWLLHSARFRIR